MWARTRRNMRQMLLFTRQKGNFVGVYSNAGTMDIDIDKLIKECVFTAARSSGSGGQKVNKVSSKVSLAFDVNSSDTLDEDQKRLILEKLANRVNKNGLLQISSESERTQWMNKKAVTARFSLLVRQALAPERKRVATKPTFTSIQKRLEEKKRKSDKKRFRSRDIDF
jgi:ribosome-associated protein